MTWARTRPGGMRASRSRTGTRRLRNSITDPFRSAGVVSGSGRSLNRNGCREQRQFFSWTEGPASLTLARTKREGGPMTEAEWLACDDPQPMLDFLRGKVGDRKLRL